MRTKNTSEVGPSFPPEELYERVSCLIRRLQGLSQLAPPFAPKKAADKPRNALWLCPRSRGDQLICASDPSKQESLFKLNPRVSVSVPVFLQLLPLLDLYESVLVRTASRLAFSSIPRTSAACRVQFFHGGRPGAQEPRSPLLTAHWALALSLAMSTSMSSRARVLVIMSSRCSLRSTM